MAHDGIRLPALPADTPPRLRFAGRSQRASTVRDVVLKDAPVHHHLQTGGTSASGSGGVHNT